MLPAAQQIPCPFVILLLFCLLTVAQIVHASDNREENLLRPYAEMSLTPSCPTMSLDTQVDLYMMSKDPRSSEALIVLSPLARVHPTLSINIYYIAGVRNGSFQSRRGEEEVQGDLWELCAINHYHYNHQWLDFIVCLSRNYTDIPNNIPNCMLEAGLNRSLMAECVAMEAPSLLQRSIADSLSLGLQPQSDSEIYINGKRFNGPASAPAVEKALCSDARPVFSDDAVYEEWWFYFLIALGAVGGTVVLVAGVLAAYRLYVKCGRASDMWLNMIKTNPGNALDFADKVQDAMHRFEKDGYHDAGSAGGGGGGYVSGGARPSQRAMEEGQAYLYSSGSGGGAAAAAAAGLSINSSSSSSLSSSLDGSPPRVQARYYEEESPLLAPPTFSTGWTMGGVRD